MRFQLKTLCSKRIESNAPEHFEGVFDNSVAGSQFDSVISRPKAHSQVSGRPYKTQMKETSSKQSMYEKREPLIDVSSKRSKLSSQSSRIGAAMPMDRSDITRNRTTPAVQIEHSNRSVFCFNMQKICCRRRQSDQHDLLKEYFSRRRMLDTSAF